MADELDAMVREITVRTIVATAPGGQQIFAVSDDVKVSLACPYCSPDCIGSGDLPITFPYPDTKIAACRCCGFELSIQSSASPAGLQAPTSGNGCSTTSSA